MKFSNIKMSFGTSVLYNDVNVNIPDNEKVGVVGVNGAGKSTLFKMIKGTVSPDSGKIYIKNNVKIGFLPQVLNDEILSLDMLVFDYLLSGRPIDKLQKQLKELYNLLGSSPESEYNRIYKKITKIEDELSYYDEYNADNILLKIIEGMNIDNSILDKKIKDLSGGEKSQVAFARLLYSKPDIILLDEPTNHLDYKSRNYVIDYLKKYKGTVLVISHDIDFLNEVTTKTLYLDKKNKTITLFNGNYNTFYKIIKEQEKNLKKLKEQETKEEDRLQEFISKYSSTSGKRKKMVKDREKKLEKLLERKNKEQVVEKYAKIDLDIKRKGNDVPLYVNNVSFGYNDKNNLFTNLNFQLSRGEKFLIMGANGVGKSTLIKLIIGQIKPLKGHIFLGDKMDVGYYAQEHEIIFNDKSIIENFNDLDIDDSKIRKVLANFLFYGDDIYKKVEVLSPGERSRVALAKLSLQGSNFLILDEPTNHLDPETQKIVAETFKEYKGTMLVVSHNKEFVSNLGIERCLILPEGKILNYDDKIISYYEKINMEK